MGDEEQGGKASWIAHQHSDHMNKAGTKANKSFANLLKIILSSWGCNEPVKLRKDLCPCSLSYSKPHCVAEHIACGFCMMLQILKEPHWSHTCGTITLSWGASNIYISIIFNITSKLGKCVLQEKASSRCLCIAASVKRCSMEQFSYWKDFPL